MDRSEETVEDKEVKSIGKILKSASDEGDDLAILTRAISYECKKDKMANLGSRLIETYPNIAFLLTAHTQTNLQFVLAISHSNSYMGSVQSKIFEELTALFELQGFSVGVVTFPHQDCLYFTRDINSNEYIGKIADTANSTVFTYLKQNNLLPEEKDEADQFLDFDNL